MQGKLSFLYLSEEFSMVKLFISFLIVNRYFLTNSMIDLNLNLILALTEDNMKLG